MMLAAASPRRLLAALAVTLALLPLPGAAEERIEPLFDALAMPQMIEIMREEGIGYGSELEADLFPNRGRVAWAGAVRSIYDADRMAAALREGLEKRMSDAEIADALAFFTADTGERIVELEVAARRAMLDEELEDTASEGWRALQAEDGARWRQLEEFARINDLIETNVAGALTSNYAFYMGLVDGKAFGFEMTESEVLADVWSQEQSVRDETEDWVYAFTALAYQPLTEEEFQSYIDFAQSEAGQALNAALFAAFNEVFADISRDLGLGAARFLAGQDI